MSADYSEFHIETTLPKPWEEEHSFNDVLYDWMSRAPWMAISAAAHILIYFILAAVPWDQLRKDKGQKIQAQIDQPPEEIFEEPEEEIVEEIEDEIEEPVLKDAEITEEILEETETEVMNDTPFDAEAFNDVIGIGGGAGGKFSGRFDKKRQTGVGSGSGTEQALKDALEWLKAHQHPDGHWDADGFSENCGEIGAGTCEGPGHEVHDVGITGLALLAMLGDGNTTNQGPYKEVVKAGVAWLREQQDNDTGLIGEPNSREFIYNHAIATLAICEAYYFGKSPLIQGVAQKAVDYIHRARNPYAAWRYDVPPIGDNDTSVTGWMIFALVSAKEGGLEVDQAALTESLAWMDEVTDVDGRVGYDRPHSTSSRTTANQLWPTDKGEALTAVGLLCRIFLGQHPDETLLDGQKIMYRQAELLAAKPPVWDVEGYGCDMYYWYYGTYAMYQMGGDDWKKWNTAMKDAVVNHQSTEGDMKGSWDPVGPWGYSGGRVYSTALMTLCIEVYYRYSEVLGAR